MASNRRLDCEEWWDAPIPGGRTAAYQAGRLLNIINWHFQHVLVLGRSPEHSEIVDSVLSNIGCVTQLIAARPCQCDAIHRVRLSWQDLLRSEEAVNLEQACANDDRSLGEHIYELIQSHVDPLIQWIEVDVTAEMTTEQRNLLNLGRCVDQGVRRSDLFCFFDGGTKDVVRDVTPTKHFPYSVAIATVQIWKSYTPGELPPDDGWATKLNSLLRLSRIPLSAPYSELQMSHHLPDRYTFHSVVTELDSCIRTHLAALDDAIPAEYLSRPMTLDQAARYHAGESVSNPTVYMNRQYSNGRIRRPVGTPQRLRFDIRDFPDHVQAQMQQASL
jgi:hypothetical protein